MGIGTGRLEYVTHRTLERCSIDKEIRRQVDIELHVGGAVETISGTNRLVIINLIVHLQTGTEITRLVFLIHLIYDLLDTLITAVELDGFIGTCLDVLSRTCQHGRHIKTALTIVHIGLVRYARTIIAESLQLITEAPALPLRSFCLNTNHRLGRCGITGTWVGNDLHVQDLV